MGCGTMIYGEMGWDWPHEAACLLVIRYNLSVHRTNNLAHFYPSASRYTAGDQRRNLGCVRRVNKTRSAGWDQWAESY